MLDTITSIIPIGADEWKEVTELHSSEVSIHILCQPERIMSQIFLSLQTKKIKNR